MATQTGDTTGEAASHAPTHSAAQAGVEDLSHPPDIVYYALAVAVGALAGLVGSLFHQAVEGLAHWPQWVRTQTARAALAAVDLTPLGLPRDLVGLVLDGPLLLPALAAVSALLVLAAVFLARTFAPEAAGSGVQEIEGALEGLREVRWKRVLPVKFFGGILALGSGLVAGREGPTIHMGACVAQAFSEAIHLDTRSARGLLAAGGAAGLAAAFNAPLAAILFVIEETRRQFPYGLRTYTAVILASAASAVVAEVFGGRGPEMRLLAPEMPLTFLPAFVVLGAILGAVGVAFNRCLIFSLDASLALGRKISPYLLPLVVGAAVGPLLVLRPEATGGGEALAVVLPGMGLSLAALVGIVAIRFAMTMASYATGVPGGIFAPILALATSIGVLYGTALDFTFDLPEGALPALAVAAMGGLFSSAVRAPLVGMVLVAELTGAYALLVPVILTCVTANIVAEALGGEPIYEVLLNRTLRLAGQVPKPEIDTERDPEAIGGWDERERRS